MLKPIEQLVLDLLTKGVKIINRSGEIIFAEHEAKDKCIRESDISLHIYPIRKEVKIVGPDSKMKKYGGVVWQDRPNSKTTTFSEITIERKDSPVIELLMKRFWA